MDIYKTCFIHYVDCCSCMYTCMYDAFLSYVLSDYCMGTINILLILKY